MNRTDFILKCREVRSFINSKGGATHKEIRANVADASGCIEHLQKFRTIYLDKNLKWRIRPMDTVEYDVKADLSFEDDA